MIDFERVRFCLEISRGLKTAGGKYDEVRLLWLNQAAMELRFNPYHDPRNGRFTSGDKIGVDFSGESGIIGNNRNGLAENDVHYIGKIDKEIYKCVYDNILTDEVVLTDERILHIKERHPNDYEQFIGYLKNTIEYPDYILEANRPYTAFILKSFKTPDENLQVILRLVTPQDNVTLKNSIITMLKISDKKFQKYLRNKKILYKFE